ncbi:MAG: O-antigen ligase family protein [Clostridia bacterium]|nr:O-antigen ligase family protein [Clostridia bacterium]
MVILSLALCLNGAFNSAYTVKNLIFAISFPLVLLGIYTLFALFVQFDRSALEHFMFCLLALGLQITAQLLFAYLCGGVRFVDGGIDKTSVLLGWAVSTTLGGMQAFLMPVCFYFAATHKHGWVFYGLGLLEFLSVLLSQSRGAMLTGAVVLLICMIAACFVGRNKKQNRIIGIGIAAVGVAGCALLWNKLLVLLNDFINRGFDDNGRYYLWGTGISKFLAHPIFGSGFYDSGIQSEWLINVYPYFYHNTFVQMLATTGLFGALSYLWHRITTVIAIVRRPSIYKSFLGFCLIAFLGFCLLDVLFFITYPLLFYTLILLYIEKSDTVEER